MLMMKSRNLIRGALVALVTVAGLGLSGGGVHQVSAGEIALTPNVGLVTGVAAPSVTVPNEMVIGAERAAGLCTNGICPLGGCSLTGTSLTCSDAAQACHVSVGGSCVPPSTAAASSGTQTTSTASSPTCSAQNCSGLDPEQTGCASDAVTNQEVFDGYNAANDKVYTDNRWSQQCQNNWSRTWETGNYGQTLYAGVSYDPNNFSDLQYNGNLMWSNMLYGGGGNKVCADGYSSTSGHGDTQCY